jgi:hypothetical protein
MNRLLAMMKRAPTNDDLVRLLTTAA